MVLSWDNEERDPAKESECEFIDRKIKEYPPRLYPTVVKRVSGFMFQNTLKYLKNLKRLDDELAQKINYAWWWKKFLARFWLSCVEGEVDDAQSMLNNLKEMMSIMSVEMMDDNVEMKVRNSKGEDECEKEGAMLDILDNWTKDLKMGELLLDYLNQK